MSSKPPPEPASGGTAASRPGGKFGGGGGGARRGKFANKPSSAAAQSSSSACGADASGSAAAAGKTRKKRVRTERQAKLFADLDEAESAVLEMIALAGETASALSDLAGGASSRNKGDNDDDDGKSAADKIAEQVKKNGENYLEKVSRVHSLLMPHADKVVAYRNHEVDTFEGGGSVSIASAENEDAKSAPAVAKSEDDKGEYNDTSKASKASVSTLTEDEKNATTRSNMYAAKVEMRLALERRDVLAEFLRLEREELGLSVAEHEDAPDAKCGSNDSATTTNKGSKRRRQG